MTETPLRILVVCTGNICRSPLTAQLLTARLAMASLNAAVTSAGTQAMLGRGMPRESEALSLKYGGDPSAHVPAQLVEAMVAEADLVLTAERSHRAQAVSLHPRAARYSYTLPQFARLLHNLANEDAENGTPPASLREVLPQVAALRGQITPPAEPADDDIEDPFRQEQEVYDRSGAQIDRLVASIVSDLSRVLRAES